MKLNKRQYTHIEGFIIYGFVCKAVSNFVDIGVYW